MAENRQGVLLKEEYDSDVRWEVVRELEVQEKNGEAESLAKQILRSWGG